MAEWASRPDETSDDGGVDDDADDADADEQQRKEEQQRLMQVEETRADSAEPTAKSSQCRLGEIGDQPKRASAHTHTHTGTQTHVNLHASSGSHKSVWLALAALANNRRPRLAASAGVATLDPSDWHWRAGGFERCRLQAAVCGYSSSGGGGGHWLQWSGSSHCEAKAAAAARATGQPKPELWWPPLLCRWQRPRLRRQQQRPDY